jgi:LysM repeat protein
MSADLARLQAMLSLDTLNEKYRLEDDYDEGMSKIETAKGIKTIIDKGLGVVGKITGQPWMEALGDFGGFIYDKFEDSEKFRIDPSKYKFYKDEIRNMNRGLDRYEAEDKVADTLDLLTDMSDMYFKTGGGYDQKNKEFVGLGQYFRENQWKTYGRGTEQNIVEEVKNAVDDAVVDGPDIGVNVPVIGDPVPGDAPSVSDIIPEGVEAFDYDPNVSEMILDDNLMPVSEVTAATLEGPGFDMVDSELFPGLTESYWNNMSLEEREVFLEDQNNLINEMSLGRVVQDAGGDFVSTDLREDTQESREKMRMLKLKREQDAYRRQQEEFQTMIDYGPRRPGDVPTTKGDNIFYNPRIRAYESVEKEIYQPLLEGEESIERSLDVLEGRTYDPYIQDMVTEEIEEYQPGYYEGESIEPDETLFESVETDPFIVEDRIGLSEGTMIDTNGDFVSVDDSIVPNVEMNEFGDLVSVETDQKITGIIDEYGDRVSVEDPAFLDTLDNVTSNMEYSNTSFQDAISSELGKITQYTVAPGDSLSAIARETNTTIPELLEYNPTILDPNKINAGQIINIPGGSVDMSIPDSIDYGGPQLNDFWNDEALEIYGKTVDDLSVDEQIDMMYNIAIARSDEWSPQYSTGWENWTVFREGAPGHQRFLDAYNTISVEGKEGFLAKYNVSEEILDKVMERFGDDWATAAAIIQAESGFNFNAVAPNYKDTSYNQSFMNEFNIGV